MGRLARATKVFKRGRRVEEVFVDTREKKKTLAASGLALNDSSTALQLLARRSG